jgi:RimJ/RimL family protein N-acetyltransferase
MRVVLRAISAPDARAILAGGRPASVRVPEDYPTEFSTGVAHSVADDGQWGSFFIARAPDDLVVGEIGGAIVEPGTMEIGYAVVPSCWGQGYATAAVLALVDLVRAEASARRLIAHAPLDRPASGRVLAKAGFTPAGEVDDPGDGTPVRAQRWELALA